MHTQLCLYRLEYFHMPDFPVVPMNLVKPQEPVLGTVVSSETCLKGGRKSAGFVRHVAIDVSGTPLEGQLHPGQSFGILPPGEDEHGKPHKVRLYSLASPSWGEDGEGKVISTTPKRVIDEFTPQKEDDDEHKHDLFLGVCSNYICDCRVGDKVQVCGPNGKRFLLPIDRNAHDYVFMATGTGIAPFRSMCMELFDHPSGPTTSQVHVVMGSPYESDLLYDELFRAYAEKHENFYYHTAISRGENPQYVHGLIENQWEDTFQSLISSERCLLYMCGLIGMQFGIYQLLGERGLSDVYMEVKDELQDVPVADWDRETMRRYIRPAERMMVEVY